MEEERGETFRRNELKENFIKDYKFIPKDDLLFEASNKVKTFLKKIDNSTSIKTYNRQNDPCHNIRSVKIPHSTRI